MRGESLMCSQVVDQLFAQFFAACLILALAGTVAAWIFSCQISQLCERTHGLLPDQGRYRLVFRHRRRHHR